MIAPISRPLALCAILFEGEPDDRCDDANQNLSPEEDAHHSTGEEITQVACNCQFAKFEKSVNYQDNRNGFGKFFEQVRSPGRGGSNVN